MEADPLRASMEDAMDIVHRPPNLSPRTSLERQLLAAIGWCAEQGKRRDVNPELVRDAARRRILELVLAQTDEHGAAGWMTVLDHLLDVGDVDAITELLNVTCAHGYPAMIPVLVSRLESAREREHEWHRARVTIERLGGRVEVPS